jgi:hypothetical protein
MGMEVQSMKHIDLHFMVKGIFPMAISTIFSFPPLCLLKE